MKQIKNILFKIFVVIPVVTYRYFTRKAFYVSGTFIDNRGTRVWFKTTFCTYGNILPIKSLEESTAKSFGVKKVVILYFSRMPYGMVKYVDKEMELEIKMGDTY